MAIEAKDLSGIQTEPEGLKRAGTIIIFPTTFEMEQRKKQTKVEKRRALLAPFIQTPEQLHSLLSSENLEDPTTIKDILYIKSQDLNYEISSPIEKSRRDEVRLTTPSGTVYVFSQSKLDASTPDPIF